MSGISLDPNSLDVKARNLRRVGRSFEQPSLQVAERSTLTASTRSQEAFLKMQEVSATLSENLISSAHQIIEIGEGFAGIDEQGARSLDVR